MPRKTRSPKTKNQRGGAPLRDRAACKGNNYDDEEDCFQDPITLECVDTDRLFRTDEGHCFNLDTLRESVRRRPINPINNRVFTEDVVSRILSGARIHQELQTYKYRASIKVYTPVYNLTKDLQLPAKRMFARFIPLDNTERFRIVWASLTPAEKKKFRDIANAKMARSSNESLFRWIEHENYMRRLDSHPELPRYTVQSCNINFSNLILTVTTTMPPDLFIRASRIIFGPIMDMEYDGPIAAASYPGAGASVRDINIQPDSFEEL